MSIRISLALASLILVSSLASRAAVAAENRFYHVNLAADLKSPKPVIEDAVTFDDDMEFLPAGVEFVLPKSLLRSYPQVRVSRQDETSRCKLVSAWQTAKRIHYRVTAELEWDEAGCDVEILVQTLLGPKRIVFTIQQIGS